MITVNVKLSTAPIIFSKNDAVSHNLKYLFSWLEHWTQNLKLMVCVISRIVEPAWLRHQMEWSNSKLGN